MPYKKLSDLSDPEALRVLGLLKAHMDSNVGKQMNPFGVLTVVRFLEEQIDVLEAETCLHNTYAIEEKLSEQDGNFAVYLEFTDTALSHVQDLANHMYMNAGEMPLQGFIPDFILDESDDYDIVCPDDISHPAVFRIIFWKNEEHTHTVVFNLTEYYLDGDYIPPKKNT